MDQTFQNKDQKPLEQSLPLRRWHVATALGGRREHATELIAILDKVFATRDRDEWVSIFEKRGVEFACSPIHGYNEVLSDPQALENEYITDLTTLSSVA